MKAAYQGVKGAYSEAAVYSHFGNKADAISFETFEDVFEAVKSGKVDYGVVPVDNTIAGTVAANCDLFLKHDVYIIAEIYLDIHHNLLSHRGVSLKDLKTAYSHPHALEQCREFIKKHKLKAVPEYDTAGAAKIVKERNKKDEAAIASEFCAKIYDLDIIEKNISTAKINITKLESRPVLETPWEYMFYVDFEGGTDDENVKLALSEMEAACEFLKVLGSYPKGK